MNERQRSERRKLGYTTTVKASSTALAPDTDQFLARPPRPTPPREAFGMFAKKPAEHGPGLQVGVKIPELKRWLVSQNECMLSPVIRDPDLRRPMFRLLSSEDRARRVEADHLSLAKVSIRCSNRTWHVRKAGIVTDE